MSQKRKGYPARTPNQIVAHNLRRARRLRGLTQEEAAERLEPFLGVRWSKATVSAAEQTYSRQERPRRFDPDEIVAFARAFKLPVGWFFLPPGPDTEGRPVLVRTPDSEREGQGLAPGTLIDLVLDVPAEMIERLGQLVGVLPERFKSRLLRQAQDRATGHYVAALTAAFGDLRGREVLLRQLADGFAEARRHFEEASMADQGIERREEES